MADAGKHGLGQAQVQETVPDFTPTTPRIFTSRFLQGHVCRPRPEVLRQGAQTLKINEVPSRIRQKGAPLLQLTDNRSVDVFAQVDMRKVNLTVIRPWVTKKVIELVGFEDEVVVEYAMGLLEDESSPVRTLPPFAFCDGA